MEKVDILNISIDNISQNDLLCSLYEGFFMPVNTDMIVKLQKDKEFYEVYQNADRIICDSKITAWGLRFLGTPIKEVIPGSSFFPAYCDYHKNDESVKIFLLGAAEGVALKAMQRINERTGRNIITGAHSPSFGFERNEIECENIVQLINSTNSTVLAVGVGAPKQEKWIFKYKDKFTTVKLFMALGATIDFEAGNIKRAPKIFQQLGLEWFFRLIKEPKRLWKRYLVDDMMFFYYLLKQKIGIYRNPIENN
jgi:exopolysaccharide biosynthesis WecB/TagA/CpsF family protein